MRQLPLGVRIPDRAVFATLRVGSRTCPTATGGLWSIVCDMIFPICLSAIQGCFKLSTPRGDGRSDHGNRSRARYGGD